MIAPSTHATLWLRRLDRSTAADAALVCFPPAAGSIATFSSYRELLPSSLALFVACLPGRDHRREEAPNVEMDWLVQEISSALEAELSHPLILFGHSFGALLAFEVARQLSADRVQHLFVAACAAPHLPRQHKPLADLPPEALLPSVRERYGGQDVLCLGEGEWLFTAIPRLRADLRLAEAYHRAPGPPLTCPITALGGMEDHAVPPFVLTGWREQTQGLFRQVQFPGGHFFPQTHPQEVVFAIGEEVRR